MKFISPGYLWFLLLLIPIAILGVSRYFKGAAIAQITTRGDGFERMRMVLGLKIFLLVVSFCGFFFCAILSLAEPVWSNVPVKDDSEDLDICFVLDISRSMLCEDIYPSRLNKATESILVLMQHLSGSRYSLIVFKGEAVKSVPMTEDSTMIESFLFQASPDMLSSPGSDIEKGLDLALKSFPTNSGRNRVIVLFSDGEGLTGNVSSVLVKTSDEAIPVYTIGMGTENGGNIPLRNGELLKNRSGKKIVTSLKTHRLKKIAERTQGEYFHCETSGLIGLLGNDILSELAMIEEKGIRFQKRGNYRNFLMLAFIFLMINLFARSIKWKNSI